MATHTSTGGRDQVLPLRVALGVILSLLLIMGSRLDSSHRAAAAVVTTSTVAKNPVTTTTIATSNLWMTNPNPVAWPTRGCNLTTTFVARSKMRPVGHCTVLEIGDSVGDNLSWGLAREVGYVHGLTLVQKGRPSTGLSNSWYYSWTYHLKGYLQQYHPNLVIVCMGANDEQPISVNGHSAAFGSPSWKLAYGAEVTKIVTLATKADARVLWVGMPIMQQYNYRLGMQLINSTVQHYATKTPGVTFMPTWSAFAGPGGTFRGWVNVNHHWTSIRYPDGVHFTSTGEGVFATYVAREMAVLYHVTLSPSEPQVITR